MGDRDARKEQLRSELAQARSTLSTRSASVGESLDFKARISKSIARNAVAWIGGAVLLGFILSRLPARKAKVRPRESAGSDQAETAAKAGLLVAVLKFAFDAARPALLKVLVSQLQPIIEKAMQRRRDDGR